jgi:AraC family transcriptional regulator
VKVMVFVKATKESEAGVMPEQKLLEDMGKFNEELVKAGIMLSGEGLHPSSKGARVRFSGKNRTVIDGPFAETKELVAGFWMWQVKSMEEAIEWVKRCPNPMLSESEIEIRRVFSAEDFGETFTPELKARDERLRSEIESYSLEPPRFENAKEMLIGGVSESYTPQTTVKIPQQWEKFAPRIGKVPGQIGKTSYGVCWNHRADCGFDYLSGVQISDATNLPGDLTQVRIPAGRYAVFTHRKHVSAIAQTIDAIMNKWFPNSGRQAANTPNFERYGEEYDPQTGMGGFEIWMPIKS